MRDEALSVRLSQKAPIPLEVELTCAAGELLGVVGPSGSGKTTLLRSIAGLYPAHGTVRCSGETWLDSSSGLSVPVQKRRVGMLFQDYALFPHLTARENVAVALPPVSAADCERRISGLFALLHIDGLEGRYPHQLSGGQQQRVALARALARDPRVLLLDEPFSAVDQQTRRKLMRELAKLHRQLSMPVLLVTHDLDEARMLADRIAVLHHGRLLQTAPPDELFARPCNATVARLLGIDNVLRGRVAAHEPASNRTWLEWAGYRLELGLDTRFGAGSEVDWVIPAERLLVPGRDASASGAHVNVVRGIIEEYFQFGHSASVALRVNDGGERLYFSIPLHVAGRDGITAGVEATVSLPADAIHLMPVEA
jgi:molybdate transport system ATP-binding protein